MFLLGGKMYPSYGDYWGSIDADPQHMPPMPELPSQQGRVPSSSEIDYARFAARTPHIILSTTVDSASWPKDTTIIRHLDKVRDLKDKPGKNTYVVGGASLVASLLDANLIDELRLIVHPIVLGQGKPLFHVTRRHSFDLVEAQPHNSGRVILAYRTKEL
jgi:dihydrofolate reductase